ASSRPPTRIHIWSATTSAARCSCVMSTTPLPSTSRLGGAAVLGAADPARFDVAQPASVVASAAAASHARVRIIRVSLSRSLSIYVGEGPLGPLLHLPIRVAPVHRRGPPSRKLTRRVPCADAEQHRQDGRVDPGLDEDFLGEPDVVQAAEDGGRVDQPVQASPGAPAEALDHAGGGGGGQRD